MEEEKQNEALTRALGLLERAGIQLGDKPATADTIDQAIMGLLTYNQELRITIKTLRSL